MGSRNLISAIVAGVVIMMTNQCSLSASASMSNVEDVWKAEGWKTDFSKSKVPFDQILSGGPGRDGIPPIYNPDFESVTEAKAWLAPTEPVIVVEFNSQARAYPLRILTWHEIVNDRIGDTAFFVTFCPLCNAAVVYDSRIDGRIHHFGVSGKLRNSDMVMWDHESESWWQQLSGEGIVGKYSGRRLKILPSQLLSFDTFAQLRPDGKVLSQETGHRRDYGRNPYIEYDSGSPFFPIFDHQQKLPKLQRVIGFHSKKQSYALDLGRLKNRKFARVRLPDGSEKVIFHLSSANSALDRERISASKKVPHVTVWDLEHRDGFLDLIYRDGYLYDKKTRIAWNALGEGFQEGRKIDQLKSSKAGVYFAFAWFGFYPKTTLLDLTSMKH